MRLQYPNWFTALDRARVDQARQAADAPLIEIPGVFIRQYVSESAAIAAVLIVFRVVVDVLSQHRARQSRDALRDAADALFDHLIVWANAWRPLKESRSLPDFAVAAGEARDAQSWWTQFLGSLPAGAARRKAARTTSASPEQIKMQRRVTRRAFVLPLLAELELSANGVMRPRANV